MTSSIDNLNPAGLQAHPRRASFPWLRLLLLVIVIAAAGWTAWLYAQIQYYAEKDQARPADAIAVFGAAEYDGRPSPVLRARLDHALVLYRQGIAPLVVTLGGGDGDQHTEGGVGHDYLLAHGVPETQIIAETESSDTRESAQRLTVIARKNHLERIVVVSDGTHNSCAMQPRRAGGLHVSAACNRQHHPGGPRPAHAARDDQLHRVAALYHPLNRENPLKSGEKGAVFDTLEGV